MMKPGCRTLLKEYGIAFCNLCQQTPGSFSRVLQSTDDQILNWGLEDGDFSNFVICSVINKFLIHSFLINSMYLWVCLFFVCFFIKCLIVNYHHDSFWCQIVPNLASRRIFMLPFDTTSLVFEWFTALWHNNIFHVHFYFPSPHLESQFPLVKKVLRN